MIYVKEHALQTDEDRTTDLKTQLKSFNLPIFFNRSRKELHGTLKKQKQNVLEGLNEMG
jgi:hypothetical protein